MNFNLSEQESQSRINNLSIEDKKKNPYLQYLPKRAEEISPEKLLHHSEGSQFDPMEFF